MKIKMEIVSDTFFEFLRNFESADAVYLALQDEFINADPVNVDEMDCLHEKLKKASDDRGHYAIVLCRFLRDCKNWVSFEADPDAPVDAPVDAPEDAPEDVPADAPEDAPADVSEDAPVQSAKCKICPSCVDGRCFFVPDQYDSDFPCLSPAWNDFFKSGGSRSPAPRARASPL